MAPQVTEELAPWVERIIDKALLKHAQCCPLFARVSKLELRWAMMLGCALGSGILGGATVAAVRAIWGA